MKKQKDNPHRVAFEEMGESEVRRVYAEMKDVDVGPSARAWLAEKQVERELEIASRRDEREERTLAISEEALSIAREANRLAEEDLAAARSSAASAFEQARWARWAAIIAMVAAIIASKDQILELIFHLLK
jgi:hypothetical protein